VNNSVGKCVHKVLFRLHRFASSSCNSCSRRRNFCTLPTAVLWNSFTNRMYRGILYSATWNTWTLNLPAFHKGIYTGTSGLQIWHGANNNVMMTVFIMLR